jgi:hypothetical protein
LKTDSFRSKKINPYRTLSLIYSIQEIALFITFRFCRDLDARDMKIQAQGIKEYCQYSCLLCLMCQVNYKVLSVSSVDLVQLPLRPLNPPFVLHCGA